MLTKARKPTAARVLTAVATASLVLVAVPAGASPAAEETRSPAAAQGGAPASGGAADVAAPRSIVVGNALLTRCDVGITATWCGTTRAPWDPERPELGTVSVGFAYRPANGTPQSRPRGVLVPHEGGPGYATTDSSSWFADMYGNLLSTHALLLVDQRGTGRSKAIECPALDNLTMSYVRAVGECGRSLGSRADLFASRYAADDLAMVLDLLEIPRIDLYGDSYGTFFAQVFAARHPSRLRTLVLDGTYPTFGETAWYPTQAPAMRRAFTAVCSRSAACAAGGDPMRQTLTLLQRVRREPMNVLAPGGDGRLHRVRITAAALSAVAFNATYVNTTYIEWAAAVRAALAGDALPLGRLVSEFYNYPNSSDPALYSPGLEAAVSCMDYPQLFDLQSSPSERRTQYEQAIAAMELRRPGIYAPFTIGEYLRSGWAAPQMCLEWPAPNVPFGPPRPPGGVYARIPTLILSGELDSITTAAEGAMTAAQFPGSRHIVVANTTHVVAGEGTSSCGARLVRRMVLVANAATVVDDCSTSVRTLPALGTFPVTLADLRPLAGWRAVAAAAAATAADARRRMAQVDAEAGAGLRGGRWFWDGGLRLDRMRFVRDLPVSGSISRDGDRVIAELTAPGADRIRAVWPHPRSPRATVTVTVDGVPRSVVVTIG